MTKASWGTYYDILHQIFQMYGSIDSVYGESFVKDGLDVGKWIYRQRNVYAKGKMSQERISKLEEIGFAWNGKDIYIKRTSDNWDAVFCLAKAYYEEYGHLRMPRNFIINGINVGAWLTNLRGGYKGANNRHLSEYQISQLELIGIEWDYDYKKTQWNNNYQLLTEYFNVHGNINLTQDECYSTVKLGAWLHRQRQLYKKGKLNAEKIGLLEQLNIRWNPQKDKWNVYYKYAQKFYEEIGNLDIPDNFVVDGVNLGRWISVQRQSYNWRQDTILTDYQIKKLEAIGMVWKGDAITQTSYFEQIVSYYSSKYFPSTIHRFKDFGFELDVYVPEMKIAIEYDGYYWHKDKLEIDNQKDSLCRKNGISLIRIREHLLQPTQYAKCYILEDYQLRTLEETLTQVFMECLSVSPAIDLNRDCFDVLKRYKIQINSPWYRAFIEAEKFYKMNGHLTVPSNYTTESGMNLNKWIKHQRQCRKGNTKKPLTTEQISLLDSIGMIWDPHNVAWDKGYSYAKLYYKEFSNLLVPQDFVYKGFRLGKWINTQRVNYGAQHISSDRLKKLETIKMVWNTKS